jgi:hypothetical protein
LLSLNFLESNILLTLALITFSKIFDRFGRSDIDQ